MNEPTAAREVAPGSSGGVCDPGDGVATPRERLLQSSLGLVENVRRPDVRRRLLRPGPEGFSPDFQVCLPYRGLFVWHVGGDDIISNAGEVLFVAAGEAFRLSEPLPGGYAELIITPPVLLLTELLDVAPARLPSHLWFRRRHRPADRHLQLLRARFLHQAGDGAGDDLAADELVIAILRRALEAAPPSHEPSESTRRLIRRTKEFVEWRLSDSIRLTDIARAVGSSPAYLTDVFRRFEGLPLHQYTLQSRLARALIELPHADDLTTLAFDLGFSSHSHFTAVFRRSFGCTPSDFRRSTRANQRRIRLAPTK